MDVFSKSRKYAETNIKYSGAEKLIFAVMEEAFRHGYEQGRQDLFREAQSIREAKEQSHDNKETLSPYTQTDIKTVGSMKL